MKRIILILSFFSPCLLQAQDSIFVCRQDHYHAIGLERDETLSIATLSNTVHLGLNMRYPIETVDSIVFTAPKNLPGEKLGWTKTESNNHIRYIIPPLGNINSHAAYYDVLSGQPNNEVHFHAIFDDQSSMQSFALRYAQQSKNWKQTMRTITKGRRIPTRRRTTDEELSSEGEAISIDYSYLFEGKNPEDIRKALFYWQNFPSDTYIPLSGADSTALPVKPVFGEYSFLFKQTYQLSLPGQGITINVTAIHDTYRQVEGSTMEIAYENIEEAQEAFLSANADTDEYYSCTLSGNIVSITNIFTEEDEDGNIHRQHIGQDLFMQLLVILDLEWTRPLLYDIISQ